VIIDGFKKVNFVETVFPLGISGTYSGLTHDTGATQINVGQALANPPLSIQPGNQSVEGGTFVYATVFSDVAGTLFIDQSHDVSSGANWTCCTATDSLAIAAGVAQRIKVPLDKRYWRARYINGGTAQLTFIFTSCQSEGV
jgi:hypothetical protein